MRWTQLKTSFVALLGFGLFAALLLLTLVPWAANNFNAMRLALLLLLALLAPLSVYLAAPLALAQHGGYWLLGWAGALLLSAGLYPNGAVTWLEPLQFIAWLAICLCLGLWLATQAALEEWIAAMIGALAVVAFVYAVGCLYIYFFALADGKAVNDDLLPWGFYNIRYWSQIASWALPLLPLAVWTLPLKRYASWRCALYITMALWFWVLLLSTARGSLLALALSWVLTLWIFKRAAWPWAKLMLATALAGGLLWLFLSHWLPAWLLGEASVREFSTTDAGRWPLWQEAWAMSWQHFPLGMGPFSWITHEHLTTAMADSYRFGHPHNMLLFWAAEYGWLAIVPLLGLVWQAVQRVRALKQQAKVSPNLIAFVASVMAALIHSNFSAVLLTPHSLLMGLWVGVMLWALLHRDLPLTASGSSPRLVRGAALLLLVWALFWQSQVWHYAQRYFAAWQQQDHFNGVNLPRFFEHGYIPHQDDSP